MKIGLDIMGGDFAPNSVVLGAIEAQKALSADQVLVLIGDQDQAQSIIRDTGATSINSNTSTPPKPLAWVNTRQKPLLKSPTQVSV